MSGPGTSEVSTYANITHSMSALKSCSCTPLLSWMAKEKHHSFLPALFANIFANSMRVINLSAFFAVLFHKKSYDLFSAMLFVWRGGDLFFNFAPQKFFSPQTPPQAAGAHVGKNVQIHWRGFSGCPELDLITLGDDVYIGTAPTVGKCGPAWMKSERFQNGDF